MTNSQPNRCGPAVFVHGNPESAAVWQPLLAELDRDDVVCLSPPGFGAPLPSRFDATMWGYRDWLIQRLEAFAAPVDLVGHDWGGAHVLNAVISRPDLVRSWVSDSAAVFHPDYEWHPLAKTWQTPSDGERLVTAMITPPLADRTASMHDLGITSPTAERLAAALDTEMGRAVLSLYRSAAQPVMADAGQHLSAAAATPGLVFCAGADDMTGTESMHRHVAEITEADIAVLHGLGHWWMVQDPAQAARALVAFWSSLDQSHSTVVLRRSCCP